VPPVDVVDEDVDEGVGVLLLLLLAVVGVVGVVVAVVVVDVVAVPFTLS
jgi:hypothetical protein